MTFQMKGCCRCWHHSGPYSGWRQTCVGMVTHQTGGQLLPPPWQGWQLLQDEEDQDEGSDQEELVRLSCPELCLVGWQNLLGGDDRQQGLDLPQTLLHHFLQWTHSDFLAVLIFFCDFCGLCNVAVCSVFLVLVCPPPPRSQRWGRGRSWIAWPPRSACQCWGAPTPPLSSSGWSPGYQQADRSQTLKITIY